MKNTQFYESGDNWIAETIDNCERLLDQSTMYDRMTRKEQSKLNELQAIRADAKRLVAIAIEKGLMRRKGEMVKIGY